MLAFLDLETTGLDLEHDDILEVACLVTDDRLAEVARYHAVVMACREFYALPEVVRDMHAKSDLWDEANAPSAKPLLVVDTELAAFLREHAVKIERDDDGKTRLVRPQLAGNGIHFDRAIMRRCLRKAEAELHYRQLDVTSVNELVRRFCPALFKSRPRPAESAHRAMPDVEESLAVARHYALNFQRVSPLDAAAADAVAIDRKAVFACADELSHMINVPALLAAIAELRERRAVDLTDAEREALRGCSVHCTNEDQLRLATSAIDKMVDGKSAP